MKYYGWNLQDLRKKQENDTTPKTTQEIAIRQVYQEMMDDCQQIETIPEEISQSQFRKAIGHFNPSYYKEEIDAILYFCHQILPIDIQLQRPLPIDYTEEDIINGARIYMQKNEPHDYNYFKKIVSNKERIHFQYTAPKTTFLGKSYKTVKISR